MITPGERLDRDAWITRDPEYPEGDYYCDFCCLELLEDETVLTPDGLQCTYCGNTVEEVFS